MTDNVYNLTATKSNSVDCVWDRVKIVQGGVASPRSKTGEVVGVWFKAVYEYDLEEFTGDVNADGGINKIFLNGVPMVWFSTDRIWRYDAKSDFGGNFTYIITGVEDTRYKLSTYVNAAGPRFIIWEKPFFETPLGVLSIMLFIAATILVAAFFFLNKSTSNMAGKSGERPSPTLVVDKEPTLNDFKDPEDLEKKQVTEIRGSANVVPIVSKAAPRNPLGSPYWSFQEVKKKPVRYAPKVAHVRASSEVPALYQGKLERSRAYDPWSKEEDAELIEECEAGKTILEIALAHQRNEGGIRSRINKLYEYR